MQHRIQKPAWNKPSFARQVLTQDEALIADSLRGGLRCAETRAAGLRAAREKHETSPMLWWRSSGGDEYAVVITEMATECRRWRAHGCPRNWPEQLQRFWYWVALRQQHEEV